MLAMSKAPRFSETDAATLFGCTVKEFRRRMVALNYTKVCERCGGCGQYSYNQKDGTVCYGCFGTRKVLLPITRSRVEEAKRRQDAGELDGYFAAQKALAAAKARIAPLVAEAQALYKPIGDAYSVEHERWRRADNWDPVNSCYRTTFDPFLRAAQEMANAIYYGSNSRHSYELGAMPVSDIEYAIRTRKTTDYERVAAELAERVEMLRALRAVFDAR
jgi:hypothetical protein